MMTNHRFLTLACMGALFCVWSALNCSQGGLPSDAFNVNELNTNQDGGGAGNDNAGGQPGDNDNDNGEPGGGDNDNDGPGGGDNDNMDSGGTTMGWRYRSIWDEERTRIEIREKHWPDGQVKEREEVRVDADDRRLKHGVCRKWFKNGRLAERGEFANGLPDGLMETWYESGARRMTAMWSAGKLHGRLTSWDESGRVVLKREYMHGVAQ